MAFAKIRKVDQENRQFKTDWTERYCSQSSAKPTCLICMQTVAVIKADNLKRHFNSIHAASFNANYPEKSDQRKQKIASSLITDLRKTEAFSLAIDSSCDRTDMEQLSVFARFFDGKTFREELLCLISLPGHTTGEIIFNELTQFFERNGLDVSKIVSVVTDGAPSMVGHRQGLVSRLSAVNPALLAFHCIIHKSVLCAKLCGKMKETMDTVTRLVNFVCESSSLQHRLFRGLLEEMSAEHKDILLHNDIRWLSKGRVLERVFDLRDELVSFLSSLQSQKASNFFSFLTDNKVISDVTFLCDIMSHLNHLNLRLQGKNHTVADMYEAIEAFRSKLHLLERDIHGRKLHFPCLREHCEKNKMQEDPAMKDFVSKLAENFKERFESSPKLSADILLFVRQPFSVSADGQWTAEAKKLVPSIDEAALQMEILEMGTSDLLKAQHKDALVSDFWINVVPQARFKNTRDIAMLLLTMFPSTYICESAFSSMNAIKSQDRNRLSDSHLGQCLRIATTEYKPDIRKVASSRRSHLSH
ncbi:unnamed protein product [Coregonus sp. 'balchen']|nr:unnamed protein product [Coregonus sp. 'balchen']